MKNFLGQLATKSFWGDFFKMLFGELIRSAALALGGFVSFYFAEKMKTLLPPPASSASLSLANRAFGTGQPTPTTPSYLPQTVKREEFPGFVR